jgi:hypothetical protein
MTDMSANDQSGAEALITAEIQNLVQRARDFQSWDEMADCYHPDAEVEISWFRGSADDFVEGSKRIAAAGTRSIHQMAPSVITVRGDRALSDTGCEIHVLANLDGIDMIVSSQARLLSRVERRDGQWRLSGFRTLYVWDTLTPVRPSRAPELDETELQRLRHGQTGASIPGHSGRYRQSCDRTRLAGKRGGLATGSRQQMIVAPNPPLLGRPRRS